ncbi:MAG: TraR/DksA C4-type zinc finger protein [Bdellovibrionota bacterium]
MKGKRMTKEQLSDFREKLDEHLSHIETEVTELRADLLKTAEVQPMFFRNWMDHARIEGDLNTRIEIHELKRACRSQLYFALARLNAGTFGLCQSCGEQIDFRRLKAQLAATRCVGCQKTEEAEQVVCRPAEAWIKPAQRWKGFNWAS